MEIKVGNIALRFNEETFAFTVCANGKEWGFSEDWTAALGLEEGMAKFAEWQNRTHTTFTCGVGAGIHSQYRGYQGAADGESYEFDTLVWVEEANETVHMEWIPICEKGLAVKEVCWPASLERVQADGEGYTLLNAGQGMIVPDTWPTAVQRLGFNGMFLTAGSYMPWFGQVKGDAGYIAIAETPWNGGVNVNHPENGPYTRVGVRWETSLGKMDYRRCLRVSFLDDCDYNALCKVYREYVKETGHFTSLEEKAAKVPSVNDLIGCSFVHFGIKTSVNPKSNFFDPENPDKNNRLTPFAVRQKTIEEIHDLDMKKVYLHLDGWAEPGYDNKHPDYTPACEEAGGWEGMKNLEATMHKFGYMFGIHDQYRDYYMDAPSFDEAYAVQLPSGGIPSHANWAGGPQSYLCTTQAPYYVRRNFKEIEKNGIKLDGAYLDVFTCNEGDECANPMHRMTRRESYEFRGRCFEWLLSHNILSSSEEVSDWSIKSLVFCHYAPYHFMLQKPGSPRDGIAVPLFNLVYHDCVIEPWMMDKLSEKEDLMLYALINGGAPYLIREGAYANTDGSFESEFDFTLAEQAERCKVVAALHEKVAKKEMVRHELLTADGTRQKSVFADGTEVVVDFENNTYEIRG